MSRWRVSPPPAVLPGHRVPVLFLDRDGVMIVEKDYLRDPAAVELAPGAAAAMRKARAAGYYLIGISNQSGLGRGLFTMKEFSAVMTRFDRLLQGAGCSLDAFYYCPHAPADRCSCRKPSPGLLQEAAQDLTWDARRSWVIGDKISDVDLADAVGLRAILVCTGHGAVQAAWLGPERGTPAVADLPAAIELILAETPR